jgi:hypothetical protein
LAEIELKYDALFEAEMARAKEHYLNRKKLEGVLANGGTWEDLQKLSFKGTEIKSYVPLAKFILKLFGDNFDIGLAL